MKRSKISTVTTMNWLNSRCKEKAPLVYKVKPEDYKRHILLERLFHKFDEDHNSHLELLEVKKLFHENGIYINSLDVKKMFNIVGQRGYSINLEQFKKFSLSTQAEMKFKGIIKEVSARIPEKQRSFIPTNFNRLMNKFFINRKRRSLSNQITNIRKDLNQENSIVIAKKYRDLLRLDEANDRSLERYSFIEKMRKKQQLKCKKLLSRSTTFDNRRIEQKAATDCKDIINSAVREAREELTPIRPIRECKIIAQALSKSVTKPMYSQQLVCPRYQHEVMKAYKHSSSYIKEGAR